MSTEPKRDAEVRAFVAAAKDFCEFMDTASSLESVSERLRMGRHCLAKLVAAGSALPVVDVTTSKIVVGDGSPPDWPGFGPHDLYWKVFDPYVDEERVTGSLSDDFLDIYRDLERGLVAFEEGEHQDAVWEWRFHFDHHWGEHAVDALRALQRACTATTDGPTDAESTEGPRVLVKTGGLVEETKISIGIHGPDVDSAAISELLGVEATSQHRAGEPRKVGPPWREGAWLFTVEGKAPSGPEEVAEEFLRALPSADDASWAALRAKHRLLVKVAVFFSGWNRGYEMSEVVLRRLAGISGSVDFDIYVD